MYQYGIIQVPMDWTSDQVVGFDEETMMLMQDEIQSGTRLLLYKPAPINAIMGEAEVITSRLENVDNWQGTAPLTRQGKPAQYVLPLKLLLTRHGEQTVPLEYILDTLDLNALPASDWIPLSANEYNGLMNYT